MGMLIYDLSYLGKRKVPIYCGVCWVRYPAADKVLLALATRRRIINVINDPDLELAFPYRDDGVSRFDPLAEPVYLSPEEFAAHVVTVKETKARVFRVVRDPKPVSEDAARDEIAGLRPHLSPEDRESDVTDALGPGYSSRSEKNGRLGMVEVLDDRLGLCNVECHRCGTPFVFDRVEAANVATHVNRFNGDCYATKGGFFVDGGKKAYRSAGSKGADAVG